MNILKDMLPYKIPPLDRQLMPEAAGEEPKGVLSCWVSLRASNYCSSQVQTWRKALKWQIHSAGVTLRRYSMSKGQRNPSRWFVLEWQLHGTGVTLRYTPWPKAKEKPQQDCRRGKTTFRIKPNTLQRHLEGSNKPCVHQDTGNQQRLRQNCVWVSPVEVQVISGLLKGQGLRVHWISLGAAADLGMA